MCFAELIAVERKDMTQGSTERMKRGLPSISFNENEIVINSAITLCGVAAKKVLIL